MKRILLKSEMNSSDYVSPRMSFVSLLTERCFADSEEEVDAQTENYGAEEEIVID